MCKLWDLDNKQYYDFAGMGVTACVLGYSNDDINRAKTILNDPKSYWAEKTVTTVITKSREKTII